MAANRFSYLLLFGILATGTVACGDQAGNNEADPLTFYYYPALNVYYAPAQNQFYFTIDGGSSWQRKEGDPQVAASLDEKVTITSDVPDVWQRNAEHRVAYRGTSVDYTAAAQNVVDDTPEANVSEKKKAESLPDSVATDEAEPKEKGLKKFRSKIRKLFKGKKE